MYLCDMKLISILESMMIDELSGNSHFIDRNRNRIELPEYYDVVSKMHLGGEIIGKYWLKGGEKIKIEKIFDFIKTKELKRNETYVIFIHKFITHVDDITFYGKTSSEKEVNKLMYNDKDVFLSTPAQFGIPSIGKYLICIIYENELKTTFLMKSIDELYILSRIKGYNGDMPIIIYDPLKELSPVVKVPQLSLKPEIDRKKAVYLAKINKYKKK